MFDIGAEELLVVAIVAIIVIGPKDLPLAMRTAGRWIGKVRRISGHFRSGMEAMIREAELEEMEKKWKAQNEKVMAEHPDGEMPALDAASNAPVTPEEIERRTALAQADAEASAEARAHAEAAAAESDGEAAKPADPAPDASEAKDAG